MMKTDNLRFLTCWSSSLLILSLFHSFRTCNADNSYCTPSSCGVIRNISFPFRLKHDPINCGDRRFELACENNVTSLYLSSHKYYVKDINYRNSNFTTIRLVDASIQKDDICSFPTISADNRDIVDYFDSIYYFPFDRAHYGFGNRHINLMTCPKALKNSSSLFINVTQCASSSSNSSSHGFHYIKVGRMYASEVPQMCELDVIVLTSWSKFKGMNNSVVSLSEIHQSLLYGFELPFGPDYIRPSVSHSKWYLLRTNKCLLIPLAILVFLVAGVSLPVTIIIGLTGVLVLSFTSVMNIAASNLVEGRAVTFGATFVFTGILLSCLVAVVLLTAAAKLLALIIMGFLGVIAFSNMLANIQNGGDERRNYDTADDYIFTGVISGMIILLPRAIIFSFVMWFLIYKFRRRHLSVYNRIESFLQSDNKLAPIRYSYSDIKKMTKGFREKLGEGGFGSVYKGKLRSGHHVAVKLLRESGGKGQDFMNEIATIGRIHHVNVVQLVGYCAEGSKRALIFDFMPHGSLEKYIFNRDKTYSLDWDKKFKIAVGVARGIEYLHRGCDIQILHFDIKPHNILLDDEFVPKISDFGLAKLCSIEKDTVTMTCARGTIGYVAPELISRSIGAVSYKADVYSFGMLLIEMVGLNRELKGNDDDSSKYFPCWIYDRFSQGLDIEIEMTEESNGNDESESSRKIVVRKMTIVGLWCIQMNPDDRPSMSEVLQMLEGDVERLQIPEYPSQSANVRAAVNEEESWATSTCDSVSLLHQNVAFSSVEITIEE